MQQLLAVTHLGAFPASGHAQNLLVGVDRRPARAFGDADLLVVKQCANRCRVGVLRGGEAPASRSSQAESTVSFAHERFVPTTPEGPRLIQPAVQMSGTGSASGAAKTRLRCGGRCRSLVEGHPWQRARTVSHGRINGLCLDGCGLAGIAEAAVNKRFGAFHHDFGNGTGLLNHLHGGAVEAETDHIVPRGEGGLLGGIGVLVGHLGDPLAELVDHAAGAAVGVQARVIAGSRLQIGRVEDHADAGECADLLELLRGELYPRRAAARNEIDHPGAARSETGVHLLRQICMRWSARAPVAVIMPW